MSSSITNLLALSVAFCFLNACGYSNSQPPAPVFGRNNPYEVEPRVVTKPLAPLSSTDSDNIQVSEYVPEPKSTLSPAVIALMAEADDYSKAREFEAAVGKVERAIRIDSRNPILLYKLAQLRLKQTKLHQAENLAKKAAILAINNRRLKRQCWLLVSEARKRQKNDHGAKEALMRANKI